MNKVSIELFTDVLCIWAYCAQVRIDQLTTDYGEKIELQYRFIPIFAAARSRIEKGWKDENSYSGFNQYLRRVAGDWEHIEVNPEIWLKNVPESSQIAHLYLKGLQLLEGRGDLHSADPEEYQGRTLFEEFLWRVRCAFFKHAENISDINTLNALAETMGLPCAAIHELINSGVAHAALHLDIEARDRYLVPGSPTLVFNESRQRLYGNVGYRIIDANIRELLRDNHTGEASWC